MDDTNHTSDPDPAPANTDYVAVEIPYPGADDARAVVAVKREIAEDPELRAAMISSVTELVEKTFPELVDGGKQPMGTQEAPQRLRAVPQDEGEDDSGS
jgi:hypothetical protein